MDPAEELYDLSQDPLELKNLAKSGEDSPILEEMRKLYDLELKKWSEQAVKGKYQRYIAYFDRHIPLSEKNYTTKKDSKKKTPQ